MKTKKSIKKSIRFIIIFILIISFTSYLIIAYSPEKESGKIVSNNDTIGAFDSSTATMLNIPNTCTEDYKSIVDTSTSKYSYDEMLKDIDKLVGKFKRRLEVRKEVIGYSELGREIPAIIIGSDNAPNRYIGVGGSHAREYIASQLLVKIAEFYLENYNNILNGEKLSDLFNRCQFHFVPMHNPDGIMLSQQGLKSLDIIRDPAEKQKHIDFLIPLMHEMNAIDGTNRDFANRDSDWIPPAEGEYDFTYWKNNINGVDVHNNMYDTHMMDWLRVWYYKPENSCYVAKPFYWNYIGESPLSQKESIALADYCKKYNFNIAITHHATGGVFQWNYGFNKELPFETVGAIRQENHKLISDRVAAFMDHSLSEGYNGHIGFTGWYLHMFPRAYSAVIELGSNAYFKAIPGYSKDKDACPLDVEQLTTDVSLGSTTRYSIWTKQKLTPAYTVQYILNNNLICPSISTPAAPRYLTASVSGRTANIFFNTTNDTGGSEITGYKLYQSIDNEDFVDVTASATLDGNKFIVSGLAYKITYYYKVSLVNRRGEGEKSPETVEVMIGEAPVL